MENTTGVKHIDTTTGFTPMQFASASNYAFSLYRQENPAAPDLASDVYQALGKPERVDIAAKEKLILVTSHPDGSGMYQVKKGRLLYNTQLSAAIRELAGIEKNFQGSTHCGTVLQTETSENNAIEVVIQL